MDNCVISAVGAGSLHREWLKGDLCEFDLHLIVYDDSLDQFQGDAPYVCHKAGYKLKVVHEYLMEHPGLLDKYEYFFIPDDDILMDAHAINLLFATMATHHLRIAQPSLVRSYYLWGHTLHDPYCRLRYTNYVEMMVPCFSSEALRKVLFTFGENDTGWGVETHWSLLIGAGSHDMAIIDDVEVVHTRPIRSGQLKHRQEAAAYLRKYGLLTQVVEYGYVPIGEEHAPLFLCDRETYWRLVRQLQGVVRKVFRPQGDTMDGYVAYVCLLCMLGDMTQSRLYHDMANTMAAQTFDRMEDMGDTDVRMIVTDWLPGQMDALTLESPAIMQAYRLWKSFVSSKDMATCLQLRKILKGCDVAALTFCEQLALAYMLFNSVVCGTKHFINKIN